MFLIWSGWGFIVVPAVLLAMLLGLSVGLPITEAFGVTGDKRTYIIFALMGLFAGGITHAFAVWRSRRDSEIVYDEKTGKSFRLLGDPGTFFFVPLRYWAWFFLACSPIAAVNCFR